MLLRKKHSISNVVLSMESRVGPNCQHCGSMHQVHYVSFGGQFLKGNTHIDLNSENKQTQNKTLNKKTLRPQIFECIYI